jgi:hypothetical protein
MSDLRNHLESARAKHLAQRYPGDLAAELLPQPRHTVLKIFATAAAVSGIAAAILLWVGSRPLATPTVPGNPIALNTATRPVDGSADDGAVAPVTTLAAVPEFPQDTPMAPTLETDDVPMAPSFDSMEIGAIPSLPSMDMNFTDTSASQTSNSKEST